MGIDAPTSLCKQDILPAVENSDSCGLVVVIETYIAIEVVPLYSTSLFAIVEGLPFRFEIKEILTVKDSVT